MANVIRELAVALSIQADNFNNGIKAAAREAKEFEKTIKPSKELAKEWGTAFAATGAVVVAALGAMVTQAANYGDAMRDAGIRTGMTTEEMSAMKYLAEQSGTSFEALQKGLLFLSKNADANAKAFKQMGIETRDSSGHTKSAKDLFGETTEKLARMSDGSEKTALMLKLFGKAGVELTEAVSGGKAAIDAATLATERFGTAVGPEAAAAADVYNDSLNDMKQAQLGLSLSIGNALLPALTAVSLAITDGIVQVKDFANAHPELIKAAGMLGVALTGAGGVLLGLTGLLTILPKLKVAFTLMTGPIGLTVIAFTGLVAGVVYFRKEIGITLMAAFATVLTGFEKLLAGAGKVARAFGADGMADKIMDAKFALTTYRLDLDKTIIANMAEYSIIQKTQKAIDIEAESRKKATRMVSDNTFELSKNTEANQKNATAIAAVIKDNNAGLRKHLEDVQSAADKSIGWMTDAYQKHRDAQIGAQNAIDDVIQKNAVNMGKHLETVSEDANRTIGFMTDKFKDELDKQVEAATKAAEKEKKALESATEDVKRSAGAIFDAMFVKGENVFASLGNLLKGGALSLGRSIFEDITGALLGPIKKAFDDFFVGLLEGTGIKSFITGLGKKLGDALGDIFGGSASTAAGGASSAAGSAGSVASSAGSAGLAALTGLVSGLVSGVIGAFGSARLEGTMNAVEYNTRVAYITQGHMVNEMLKPMTHTSQWMLTHAEFHTNQLDLIYTTLMEILSALLKGHVIEADSKEIARTVLRESYGLTRNEGRQIIGAR